MDFFFGFSPIPPEQGVWKMVKSREWVIGNPPAVTKLVEPPKPKKFKVPLTFNLGRGKK